MNVLLRLLPVLLLVATSMSVGCARTQAPPARTVRVAVLDGLTTPELRESRRSTVGWWLGARNRYDNANAGIQLADALATEFDEIPGVQVHPRTDVRALFAEKEHLLRREFPEMTEGERRAVLAEQDPVDYGRSLNVDYVLASEVGEDRLVHKTTFNWWFSKADARVDLYDVQGGERIWSWSKRDTDWFASPVAILRDLAGKAAKRAEKEDVFRTAPPE